MSRKYSLLSLCVFSLCSLCLCGSSSRAAEVAVGSKIMVESRILAEILAHLARDAGATLTHQEGLGGTLLVWQALLKGDIDAYVEYTGTIGSEILSRKDAQTDEAMRQALAEKGIRMSSALGF